MILRLLSQIAATRPAAFPVISVGVAAGNPVPRLCLYPGVLDLSGSARDASRGPGAVGRTQDIPAVKGSKSYTLDQSPLAGTVRCEAVFGNGTVDERRLVLLETGDYEVDAKGQAIRMTPAGIARLDPADRLRISYSFVGLRTVMEFKETFRVEVSAASSFEAEKWSALFAGLVLTAQHALIDAFNDPAGAYSAGSFVSQPLLDSFIAREGKMDLVADGAMMTLTFLASGRLEMTDSETPDFGLIQKIVSPGRTASGKPVDVEVGLE